MGDDFIADDILAAVATDTDSVDFDPNAVESDDFLDDPKEEGILDDIGIDEEEDDDIFGEDE